MGNRSRLVFVFTILKNNHFIIVIFLYSIAKNLAHQVERMNFDLASVDLPTQTLELLHKAAYRTGLGNSLYSPEHMVGMHKTQALLDFHQNTHTTSR